MKTIGYKLKLVRFFLMITPSSTHQFFRLHKWVENIGMKLDDIVDKNKDYQKVVDSHKTSNTNCIKPFTVRRITPPNQMVMAYFNYVSEIYCGACEIDIPKSDLVKNN